LLNGSSGTAAGKKQDDLHHELRTAFERHGIAARIEFLPGPSLLAAAQQALQTAKNGETDAVIAGGGDGSIRTVASVLAHSGVPLGVLPLGTLNHFAKDLKIPLAIDDAVTVIARGNTQAIDVGEANGRVFINNSSIGLYPSLVLDRDRRQREHHMPKWLAMGFAGLRTIRDLPIRRLVISTPEKEEVHRSPCLFIGNNAYGLSGLASGSRERLDEGRLCLYITKQDSSWKLIGLAAKSIFGFIDQERDLRSLMTTEVKIRSRRKRLLVAFDGEVEIMQTPLHYTIQPRALRVFKPDP
jgi:diacylglycerol kinase family enzyme